MKNINIFKKLQSIPLVNLINTLRISLKQWFPILFLTTGMLLGTHVYANLELESSSSKPAVAESIYRILREHYQKRDSDPIYIIDDLKNIANYYSHFPEIRSLLEVLDEENWQLTFNKDNWATVAHGNLMQVEKATIHFNTRSAAQLRLNNNCNQNPVCIASPADALLHELLHTHSMLVNSNEFIAQGGMNPFMYPYRHEYTIIDTERKLYAAMSKRDTTKRPQRIEHTGRFIKANCPTCIK